MNPQITNPQINADFTDSKTLFSLRNLRNLRTALCGRERLFQMYCATLQLRTEGSEGQVGLYTKGDTCRGLSGHTPLGERPYRR